MISPCLTLYKLSPSGKWERTGPKAILVKPESAIQRGSLTSDILPVDQDHSDIVKFAQDDTNYRGVLIYLHDLCESLDGPKLKETQVQSSFSSWLSVFSKSFRKKQSNVEEDTLKSELSRMTLVPAYTSLQKPTYINWIRGTICLPPPMI